MPDKCCGTCKWWREQFEALDGLYGRCRWHTGHMPVGYDNISTITKDSGGTDCPCHKQKEDGREP